MPRHINYIASLFFSHRGSALVFQTERGIVRRSRESRASSRYRNRTLFSLKVTFVPVATHNIVCSKLHSINKKLTEPPHPPTTFYAKNTLPFWLSLFVGAACDKRLQTTWEFSAKGQFLPQSLFRLLFQGFDNKKVNACLPVVQKKKKRCSELLTYARDSLKASSIVCAHSLTSLPPFRPSLEESQVQKIKQRCQ